MRRWGAAGKQLSSSGSILDIQSEVSVEESYQLALQQLPVRRSALENFVNRQLQALRRRSRARFTVAAVSYTCGQGHEAGPSGTCAVCKDGFKTSLRNEACTPCPANAFTPPETSNPANVTACRCREGYLPEGRGASAGAVISSDADYWAGPIACEPVNKGAIQGIEPACTASSCFYLESCSTVAAPSALMPDVFAILGRCASRQLTHEPTKTRDLTLLCTCLSPHWPRRARVCFCLACAAAAAVAD